MTEREKMLNGEWYDANFDQELIALRDRAEELCFNFNHTPPSDKSARAKILRQLLPRMAEDVTILAPFYTDYGTNCTIGEGTFINHGAYLMDGAAITIGSNCFIGPNFGCYTASPHWMWRGEIKGWKRPLPLPSGTTAGLAAT